MQSLLDQTTNNRGQHAEKFKEKFKGGFITLPPMTENKKENSHALKVRVKELKMAPEHSNLLIYGLNFYDLLWQRRKWRCLLEKSVVPNSN